jgi:adenylosuccinate lyase
LIVYPEKMKQNLDMTRGLVYSQSVLLALTRAGLSRETAYKIVQDAAMQTWSGDNDLMTNLKLHPDLPSSFPEKDLLAAFDPAPFMSGLDAIYERVLGDHHHHSGNEGC